MNINIGIDARSTVAGLTRLARADGFKTGLQAAGTHLRRVIAVYPARRYYHLNWAIVSPRMRRAFFAKLRSGEIQVPYVRSSSPGSQRLGTRWGQSTANGGMTVTVGNTATYAPIVQGGARQSSFHRQTNWRTDRYVAEGEAQRVVAIVFTAIQRETGA